MINITIAPAQLAVSGHAGYNPGNDIVCAAVSALVQTLKRRRGNSPPMRSAHGLMMETLSSRGRERLLRS